MKKFILVLSYFYITLIFVKAQSNFINGYIININNDTIYGLINNNNYYLNSQYCEFKKDNSSNIKKYYPIDLVGYRFIDGKFYISKNLKIDDIIQKKFIEYLIDGKIDIFFYRDENKSDHYFVYDDTLGLKELKYNKEYKNINGRELILEQKYFVEILKYYTKDCPDLHTDIQKINQPNHNTYIKIAEKYHNLTCNDEPCILYEKKIKPKLLSEIQAGTKYQISGFIEDYRLMNSLGFNIYYQFLNNSERLFASIGYFRYDNIIAYDKETWGIPIAFNYIHPKNKWSPLASFGVEIYKMYFSQFYKVGLKYQFNKFAINIMTEIITYDFFLPVMTTQKIGILYNIRN